MRLTVMRTILTTLALLLLPCLASAQEIENIAGVRLTFDRPGARSLAMGSTGIAMKDASLAATNPAAIAGASRSFSIETRRRSLEGRYILDDALHTMDIDSSTSGIRSFAFTMPMSGLTWSFFYDEPLDVHHSTGAAFATRSQGGFFICDGHPSTTPCNSPLVAFDLPATFPVDARLRLQRYGVATAWTRGPLAVGASVRREHFRQQTGFIPGLGPNSGVAETSDDAKLTWSGGTTWSFSSAARIGATYSSGGSFASQRTFYVISPKSLEFRTPSSIGAGIAIDPLPQFTLAADAVRVRYSEMMHDQRGLFLDGTNIGYPDVTELHAGAEYRVGGVALRAGWWRDPAHALTNQNGAFPRAPFEYLYTILDSTENHMTAGIGIGSKTRFDASIDHSARTTQVAFAVGSSF
jgi:hypothetical protein